jgi:hypothetical protein
MRFLPIACFSLVWSVPVVAQQAPRRGVESAWDITSTLQGISAHAKRLLPLLNEIDPQPWVAKGAPEAYVGQLKSAKTQAETVALTAQELAKDPEKLSASLQVFFRMQALENVLTSLVDGIRRYHNPAMADLLQSILAENGAGRERFQQYIIEMAANRENEFAIMDKEAQRCRDVLVKQPPPRTQRK